MGIVELNVTDNEHLHRYEATVDGQVAGFIRYRDRADGVRDLQHTEVDPAYEGKGVGSGLVSAALDAIRASGRTIVPSCPFVTVYLKRHEEYRDLVAPA
jgi:predicted GNAT family acetyltransferase